MSSTRHKAPGSPFRQECFASSFALESGLLANLVAKRCALLHDPHDRELVFALQSHSHQPGGFGRVASEVVRRGYRPEPKDSIEEMFNPDTRESSGCYAEEVIEELRCLCLNPSGVSNSKLKEFLRDYLAGRRACPGAAPFVPTALSRAVWSEIQEAHEMRNLVLLHNSRAVGTSTAAEACCAAFPGRARYALTPASNDELSWQREIARALGNSAGLSQKAIYLRERNLEVLRGGDLVLVLDAAQHLFPVTDYRYALPNRLNWVLSDLAEHRVPVVMIANSTLFDTLGFVEKRTGWSRAEFVNKVEIVSLPDILEVADMRAVAAALLPDGDRAAQHKLADYMIAAPGYLHAGEPAAARARKIAHGHARDRVTLADMEQVLESRSLPAIEAQKAALARADEAASRCKATVRNYRADTPAQTAAKSGKRRQPMLTSSDLQPAVKAAKQTGGSRAAMPPQAVCSDAAEMDFPAPRRGARGGVLTSDQPAKPGALVTA